MADEAGGLQEGLRQVNGKSVLEKLKTCEFHFLQCPNRQRARLQSEKSSSSLVLHERFSKRKPRVLIMILFKSWRNLLLRNPPKINAAFLFLEQEVRSIFQRAPPPFTQPKPALGKRCLVTKSSTRDTQSNADTVIRNDSRSNHLQVWRLERLNRSAGPTPHFVGCKKVSLILVIFCWRLMLFMFHVTRNFVSSAHTDSVLTLLASLKWQGFQI